MNRKLITEAIGTFFLVLTIGLVVSSGTQLAPLAIGAVLMTMVYMGGHVSGAHYNPAVTLAILLRGKIGGAEAGAYVVAQLAGSVLAAAVVLGLTGAPLVVAPDPNATPLMVLTAEALFTFALALVVLNVATTRATEGNSYYGLAIGFTVLSAAFAVGGISGGALNPAVGIGPILVAALAGGDSSVAHVGYYLAGPLAGAALAAFVFRLQNPVEFAPPEVMPFSGAVVRDPELEPEAVPHGT